ncbi:MAG: HAD family hydrolase [Hoeflea sp.]|uniref:HAD family hydrolase n=1 Tax=Hoeflea sp. TaxID=1940281 RepID=UPI001D4BED0C|nr:HAD family hydrolase [Hoeflea sp.]MBU4527268.1 HAD family hydrolase [Alphaproteobacteria bacterium]MBU4546949.1 HAD family hydrolase [Alphaproteobacteria bacterium]MBU4551539.1 HAD family hydrolase [Alphaproteobacteria bacterium]MBV1725544.1 HAD family hydrolase [Hoeflea sp.]MBV1759592.1 HAD family hydrolase [Hoeflea sp.]
MTSAANDPNGMSQRKFVLATDLDGTFLGGSEEDRRRLYNWIEDNRETVGLIFVTGRDPQFIGALCRDRGVPWPDYAVGDVGTTIATVSPETGVAPIEALEEEISASWGNAGERVRARLDGHPGLTLQPTDFRYRVSYDIDADSFDASAWDIVLDMGFQPLISDNRFFDVLPDGVSKGPSLRRLVEHLSIQPERVLCAGDTLNDLSMLECGLPAVAVGNSEAELVRRVAHLEHLHMAKAHGAAGILEAIRAFDMHELPEGY